MNSNNMKNDLSETAFEERDFSHANTFDLVKNT